MTLLSVKTLRHYHDVGLLPPAEIDPGTGYRRYGVAQVPTAQVIRRLRELGMSLDDVRAVIEAPDVRARNAAINAHLRRMEGQLEQTRATVKSLRLLLEQEPSLTIAVGYRVSGPADNLAIRDRVAYADVFGWLAEAFAELRSAACDTGARRTGADAALYSSELLEDEFGEIVAVVPVESAAKLRWRQPARDPRGMHRFRHRPDRRVQFLVALGDPLLLPEVGGRAEVTADQITRAVCSRAGDGGAAPSCRAAPRPGPARASAGPLCTRRQ